MNTNTSNPSVSSIVLRPIVNLAGGIACLAAAVLATGCGREGPEPENKDSPDFREQNHPAHGTTGTGGSKNGDNSDEDAGKGVSGSRPDDNIPIPREGRD